MSIRKLCIYALSLSCIGNLNAMQTTKLEFPSKGINNSCVIVRVVTGEQNSQETDITRLHDVDVIVNAANELCLGGGGVDGAVHKAAGMQLAQYIEANFKADAQGVRCTVGTALATPSFNLSANGISCIVHAVGPTNNDSGKEKKLSDAYRSSLRAANAYAQAHQVLFKSIAFPSISTGIYGYPVEEACSIALSAVIKEINKGNFPFAEVRFVVWPDNYTAYSKALRMAKSLQLFHQV